MAIPILTSFSGVILDIFLVLFLAFGGGLRSLVSDNLTLSYAVVGVLQVVAVCAAITCLRGSPQTKIDHWIDERLLGLKGLMAVLCFGGFMWFFIPMQVIDRPAILTFNVLVSLFGSLLAVGYLEENRELLDRWWVRTLLDLGVLLYLSVSESILVAVSGAVPFGVVLLGLGYSWIPIRIMLLLRPPVRAIELLSSTAMVIFLFVQLFRA